MQTQSKAKASALAHVNQEAKKESLWGETFKALESEKDLQAKRALAREIKEEEARRHHSLQQRWLQRVHEGKLDYVNRMERERIKMEERLKNVSEMEKKEGDLVRRMQETQKRFEKVQQEVKTKGSVDRSPRLVSEEEKEKELL